jgi:hypothetical protein
VHGHSGIGGRLQTFMTWSERLKYVSEDGNPDNDVDDRRRLGAGAHTRVKKASSGRLPREGGGD